MDELKQRYIRFIEYINELSPENDYIHDLQNMDAYIFVLALKTRMSQLKIDELNEKECIEEAYNRIIEKTNIDESNFTEEQKDKFKRYLAYFRSIALIIK